MEHVAITGFNEIEIKAPAKYLCFLIQNAENSSLTAV
jgi:hypothetical protein